MNEFLILLKAGDGGRQREFGRGVCLERLSSHEQEAPGRNINMGS